MKKTSKVLGSIALSAALAMGTAVPAFAAESYWGEDDATTVEESTEDATIGLTNNSKTGSIDNDADGNGASTVIKASTYTSQLSVTVPLAVPLKFDTVGGAGLGPSKNKYYIQNNSSTNISVTEAAFAISDDATDDWNFSTTYYADSNAAVDADKNLKYGDFYLGINPTATQNANKAGTAGNPEKLELKAGDSKVAGDQDLNWGIKPNQKYGFELTPSSSKLNASIDENDAATIAAITYTVRVGLTETALIGTTEDDTPDPSKGWNKSTFSVVKTKTMNQTGLEATFGGTSTYTLEGGGNANVTTGTWTVVSAQIVVGSSNYPVEDTSLIENTNTYKVVVKAAE